MKIEVDDYVHWVPLVEQAITGANLTVEDRILEGRKKLVSYKNAWRIPFTKKSTIKDITEEMVRQSIFSHRITEVEQHLEELENLLEGLLLLNEGVALSVWISDRELNLVERYRIRFLESRYD